jgi:hypothetical protein
LRLVALVAFLLALALAPRTQWGEVAPLLGRTSPLALAAALAAVLAGIFATFLCWRAVLSGLAVELPMPAAMRVFFLGQLGKYLPGSLWPAVAQMELGRDYRVAERTSGAAVVVFLLLIVATGLALTAALAPLLGPDAVHVYWWLVAVLPLALLVTVPPVLNRLLGLALRLARRPPLPVPLSTGPVLRAAGWSLAAWVAYGVHVWVLAVQLGVPVLSHVWLPGLLDSLVPFAFLVTELLMVHYVGGDLRGWLLGYGLVALVGVAAWAQRNLRVRQFADEEGDVPLALAARHWYRAALAGAVTAFGLLGWVLYDALGLASAQLAVAVAGLAGVVVIIASSVPMWNQILRYARGQPIGVGRWGRASRGRRS